MNLWSKSLMVTTTLAAGIAATATWNSCSEMEVKPVPGFSADVADIIIKKCTPCHAGGKSEKGLGFIDKPALLISKGYIIPGDSAGSLLYKKVSAKPPYGDRMPKGGPYLSDGQLATIANWIDTMEDPAGTKYSVAVSASAGITTSPTGTASVSKNRTLAITTTPDSGVTVSQSVGGTCAAGTWSGSVYTTGKITADCSVVFTKADEASVSIQGSVPSHSEGDIRDISFDLSSLTIEKGQTASFDFTVRANDTINVNDETNLVSGTCAVGDLTMIDAATRRYRYTTGAITSSCTVTVQTDNPCPEPTISSAPTFADVAAILDVPSVKCTGCHDNGSESSTFPSYEGAAVGVDEIKITTSTHVSANGMKLITAKKPLSSSMYLQVDPNKWFRGSRMPQGGATLDKNKRNTFCHWIKNL